MHLWFLVHGLYGDVGNLQTLQEALALTISKSDHVHIASSNQRFYTFDGIEVGALRLYDELMHVIAKMSSPVTHISIVGYSLGGLYTRFLIGLLEESGFFEYIQPIIYATFATPHLGSIQWNPKYCSWLLNGMGSVLLGVSGSELLCRYNWGLLQALSDPGSKYYQGLKRFKRRFLFANAVNDRSVHFWTAFITNKVPFVKDHGQRTELSFYSYNGDPQGHFILDLARSRHIDTPPLEENKAKASGTPTFIKFGAPIMIFILFFVSMRSFICYPFLLMKWRWKYRRLRATASISQLADPSQHQAFSDVSACSSVDGQHGEFQDMESHAQMALDTLPPKDYEGDDDDASVTDSSAETSYPKPALNNEAPFVDRATEELPFSKTMMRRMNNLNSLGWEKYVVYLDQHWSHAHIINRRHFKKSQGSELLKFFAEEAAKVKT